MNGLGKAKKSFGEAKIREGFGNALISLAKALIRIAMA